MACTVHIILCVTVHILHVLYIYYVFNSFSFFPPICVCVGCGREVFVFLHKFVQVPWSPVGVLLVVWQSAEIHVQDANVIHNLKYMGITFFEIHACVLPYTQYCSQRDYTCQNTQGPRCRCPASRAITAECEIPLAKHQRNSLSQLW